MLFHENRDGLRRHGFSLVELLIVVSLMGILTALLLPTLNPGAHEELHATAQIVCGDLAYGRSLAVANNSSYRIRFQLNGNQYILEHSGTNDALDVLPAAPFRSPTDPPQQQIVSLSELPHLSGQNTRLVAVTGTDGSRLKPVEIEFGPLGETTRTAETVIWLAAGSKNETRYVTIHINPVSGLATLGAYTSTGPASPTPATF